MPACSEYETLLSGFVDQELDPDQTQKMNTHLIRCAGCREAYEELVRLSDDVEAISFLEPQDEALEKLWGAPYSRFIRNSGIFLVLAGWACLVLYGTYQFLIDRNEAPIPKMAAAAVFIGFGILLYSVIRDRIKTYSADPYKEIER